MTPNARLKARRLDLGLQAQDVADRVGSGCSRQVVYGLEGDTKASEYFVPICLALGVNPIWVWTGQGERELAGAVAGIDTEKLTAAIQIVMELVLSQPAIEATPDLIAATVVSVYSRDAQSLTRDELALLYKFKP